VNLLPRLMDPTSGAVEASGVPVDRLEVAELRRHIAMVPQHAYLFSGTIAETVSGVPAPDAAQRERVEWALQGAQATEFVSRLDAGIDSRVEPGGTNFSGGQRQRLSIARALYRRADLYVFDDSFSALDYATDARLRLGLPDYVQGGAVLIVAQRVATIRHAETIVVLEDGKVVGRGTHAELMESSQTYREIVASQMSEEEAA
ncbi:MAG: ABC transporter ATP-binding protein/permease, partial [Propionibacterium sp.]|nr:ABC transporter ATP-binding protein/permease [Propionibacterium sp.]